MSFESVAQFAAAASEQGLSIGELVLKLQSAEMEIPEEKLFERMDESLSVCAKALSTSISLAQGAIPPPP